MVRSFGRKEAAMTVYRKPFAQLTVTELYEILRLRSAVFVVEQNCVYQDIDGRDPASLHVFSLDDDGQITACLRVFRGEDGIVRIGRVVSAVRGKGYGKTILQEGIAAAQAYFGADVIRIEAQVYAAPFYEREGFRIISEPFLEDGIPHVHMVWNKEERTA